jgi:hypothetical protein
MAMIFSLGLVPDEILYAFEAGMDKKIDQELMKNENELKKLETFLFKMSAMEIEENFKEEDFDSKIGRIFFEIFPYENLDINKITPAITHFINNFKQLNFTDKKIELERFKFLSTSIKEILPKNGGKETYYPNGVMNSSENPQTEKYSFGPIGETTYGPSYFLNPGDSQENGISVEISLN